MDISIEYNIMMLSKNIHILIHYHFDLDFGI